MALSLKRGRLKRYKDVATLLRKYGRSELIKPSGLDDLPEQAGSLRETAALGEQLACDLEKLGPTFVKIGQMLSTRPDLLPVPVLEALSRLQDKVEPIPFSEVEATVTAELGVRISKGFAEFEKTPLASASLGQVHRATMRDGRPVAVKVQRPGLAQRLAQDLDALADLASVADRHSEAGRRFRFVDIVEEFRKTLFRELDYRQEARNLLTLRDNLSEFDRIVVPRPVEGYTTSRVLTVEYVRGQKITSFSPVVRTEIEGEVLAEQLFRAYLQQILVDGFVHADPHPGNVFLTDDNRVALLDLGMVSRIAPSMQEKLLELLLAVSEGRGDEAADIAMTIGEVQEHFDELTFRRRVGDLVAHAYGATVERIEVGKAVMTIARISADCGVRCPAELTMLGKTLLNLDQVGRTLHPGFDPNAAVRRNALELTQKRMRKSVSAGNVFASLMELREFVEKLPGRANKILDHVANNTLRVDIDAIDEKMLMEGFQKIANRITLGLILAALIVGAAMLMRIETTWRILGYPAVAMILFMTAAGGGVALALNIIRSDESRRRS